MMIFVTIVMIVVMMILIKIHNHDYFDQMAKIMVGR